MLPIFTIGHSNRSIGDFVSILQGADIEMVADVRTVPRSRANPQFGVDRLPGELEPFGIAYERFAGLGGLRGRSRDVPFEINGYWENASFHNYADYALSASFEEALDHLMQLAAKQRTAMMCAEAVWWRCHRRIIADYLLERGRTVVHLMSQGRMEEARMTPGAQEREGKLVYPASISRGSTPARNRE